MSAAEAMFFAHPFWTWIAVAAIFLIGELLTGSGWLLWPAGAAAVVGVATRIVTLSWPWQVVLFVAVAIAATYVGRRLMPQRAKAEFDINDPLPRLVGQRGEAVGAFSGGCGRVFVDGKEWAAECDGAADIAAGQKVEITSVLSGAKLQVKAA